MTHSNRIFIIAIISLLLFFVVGQVLAATSPGLGKAKSFLVFGASAVTNVPTSFIDGDVGLSPAAGTNYSGLTTLEVSGTIYAVDATGPAGVAGEDPSLLTTAKGKFEEAYDALSAAPNVACTVDYGGAKDLSGETLVPGVYCATVFSVTTELGPLTLDNSADPLGVWIFRSSAGDTSLFTSVGASVIFADETVDSSCGVWWKVPGTATIASGTSFIGNILALTSITLGSGASLEGRAFAETAEVTLDNNTITYPICDYQAPPDDEEDETPGLPETGSGALILNEISPWGLALLGGAFTSAVIFGVRSSRKNGRLKK